MRKYETTLGDAGQTHLIIFNEDASMRYPRATMDTHIHQYEMEHHGQNISAYEEEWLDDPWIRVLIRGAEHLQFQFNHIAQNIASFVQDLTPHAQIAILFANPAFVNPKPALDNAVDVFVNGRAYNAFVDVTKYPYVRIVIIGLNSLPYEVIHG